MSEWTIWAGLLLHRMVRLVVCVPEPRRSGSLPPFPLVLSFLGLRYSPCVAGAPRFNWMDTSLVARELTASQTAAWILSWRGVA